MTGRPRSWVRRHQWWHARLPPLVGVAATAIAASRPMAPTGRTIADLALFLVSAAGVAAVGHVVNDLCDIDADGRAGKANAMAVLGKGARVAVLSAALGIGLAPWAALPRPALAVALLGVELTLLVVYSVPPVRLKERGIAGVLADALYGFTVPILLAGAVFASGRSVLGPAALAATITWSLLAGVRGILAHQAADRDADRRSGTSTYLADQNPAAVERARAGILLSAEVLAAVATVALLTPALPALPALAAAYLAWRVFQLRTLWPEPLLARARTDGEARIRLVGFVLINEFVERWFPLVALVTVALRRPGWWWVVAAHVVLFDNAARELLGRDLRGVPDAVYRLWVGRQVRTDVERAAERRAGLARHPPPVPDPDAEWSFVFVVCGPASHLHTLHRALRELRRFSGLPAVVVTDTGRNEVAVEHDHVVDVATPADLDDHQASIWLKTSLPRWIDGRRQWCYLDSDVIAAGPDVDTVFDHHTPPVTFASDTTIRDNNVDRFSPWAMRCPCRGTGVEHSCSHLREGLQRLFGLEPPPDWVQWNGGVFTFDDQADTFFDAWHQSVQATFADPGFLTRDQPALIATAWRLGLQDQPRLPRRFNFIGDLGNSDLGFSPSEGWTLHPSEPPEWPALLHLYTSRLEDPAWDMGRDLEEVVITAVATRRAGHRRNARQLAGSATRGTHTWLRAIYWWSENRLGLTTIRLRRMPVRLRPARVWRSCVRRLDTRRERRRLRQCHQSWAAEETRDG